jgi:parvulin-like peptidyl-prolyl isomerase
MARIYSQYGISGYPYSLSESPKDQVITEDAISTLGISDEYVGQTYHDYFMDSALNSLRQEFALRAAAKAAGYTLSDEGKAAVDEAMESIDSARESYLSTYGVSISRTTYLQMVYGDLASERSYRTYVKNAQLASEYSDLYFDDLANYSDEELDAYYQENKDSLDTFTYYFETFSGVPETTEDEDGNTVTPTDEELEAAMTEAEENANAALAAYEADPDLDAVIADDNFSEATGTLTNPTAVYYDWLVDADRQPGDATIIGTDTGYSLLVYSERYLIEEPTTADVRHILISAMQEDDPDTEDVDESTEDPTDEEFEAARQTALDLLEQWKANGGTEDAFADLANEYSADTGSNTNGGLYESIYSGNGFIQGFLDWALDPDRVSGDISDPIQNTESSIQGYHLIYFVGWDEPVWKTTARQAKWAQDVKDTMEIVRTDKLDTLFD